MSGRETSAKTLGQGELFGLCLSSREGNVFGGLGSQWSSIFSVWEASGEHWIWGSTLSCLDFCHLSAPGSDPRDHPAVP